MPNHDQLVRMSQIDVLAADKSSLVNLESVTIDTSLPIAQRMESFFQELKNPYLFLCGQTPVRITFKKDGRELSDILQKYFLELKERG